MFIPRRRNEPTHFFAVEIDSYEIRKSVQHVQNHICSLDNGIKTAVIPVEELHLTCCTMKLNDGLSLKRAEEVLQSIVREYPALLPSAEISFAGIGHFGNKVIYANIQEDGNGSRDRFRYFSETLKSALVRSGVEVTDRRRMNPHLTIMKLSKDEAARTKGVTIDPLLYAPVKNIHFGSSIVKSVQLCEIGERDPSGYYRKVCEVFLPPGSN